LLKQHLFTSAQQEQPSAWQRSRKLVTLCTSGSSGLGQSGSDLSKLAKGCDYKGGKDFTRTSGAEVKNYLEGLLK